VFETPDVDTQTVKRFDRAMRYIYDIKFGILQVRKNEISLRKCSGCSAQLRRCSGNSALVVRKCSGSSAHLRIFSNVLSATATHFCALV